MARSFSHDLPVSGSPSEAQARLRGVMIERLRRSAKMRLANQQPSALTFRPRWSWPVLLALYRMLSGEVVNVSFSAGEGGTRVAVSGKVAGNAEAVADREFWTEIVGAT
jgi:hypothetical protein